MNVKGNAPEWALELVKEVCKDYTRGQPGTLTWRNCNRDSTSGSTYASGGWTFKALKSSSNGYRRSKRVRYWGEIRIRAGRNEQDQRLVLLHELAHHIVGKSRKGNRMGHTLKFWRLAFELYQRYNVELEYAIDREKYYKQKANWAISELNN